MTEGFNYSLHQVEDLVIREFGWNGETASDGAFKCYCPIHGDKNASLMVALKNGKILIRCLSHGCETQIYKDLSAKGAWPQQMESAAEVDAANKRYEKLYPERAQNNEKWNSLKVSHSAAVSYQKRLKDSLQSKDDKNPVTFRLTASYVYTDGEFTHSVIARYDPIGGGKKRIVQHSWGYYDPLPETANAQDNKPRDPSHPAWQWRGWSNDEIKHMVYDVTHLRASPNATVVIVEGEKAADYFNSRIKAAYPQYVATTWRGGSQNAKNTDWSSLQGRDVIILPDADEPGIIAADHVRAALLEITNSVRIVDIMRFKLPKGWDVADYADRGVIAPKFLELIVEQTDLGTRIDETSPIIHDGELVGTAVTSGDFSNADITEAVLFFYKEDKSHYHDAIAYFNDKFARIYDDDKVVIAELEMMERGSKVRLIPETIFRSLKMHVRIQHSKQGPLKPAYDAWVESKNRIYDGIRHIPNGGRVIKEDSLQYINVWRDCDASRQDQSGSCELFINHMKFIASGEENADEVYRFLITWLAWMVQRPLARPGIILIFRGKQGTGKSIIGKYLMTMIGGDACLSTNDLDKVTGKFNSQLLGKVLVLLEEVKFRRNDQHDRIKDLATNDFFSMEAKGRATSQRDNYLHFMATSNEDYVVPIDNNERRFVPIDVPDTHMQDKEYFGPLTDEMRAGGPAALYKYLKEFQLPNKFPSIPVTKASSHQRQETSSNSRDSMFLQWYALCLRRGAIITDPEGGSDIKWTAGNTIDRSKLFEHFNAWEAHQKRRQLTNATLINSRAFFKAMRPFFSGKIPSNDASKDNPPLGRFVLSQSGFVKVTFPKLRPAKTVFNAVVNNDDSYGVFEEESTTDNMDMGDKQ